MSRAVIVDAVRTPLGKRNGCLSGWHPADLGAHVLNALVSRTGIDPALVDDVIMGCVTQVGAQSTNLGRSVVLAAGWPETVPATTVDRQCGSSQQALHFAAQGVMAGVYEVVVAAGVEMMSVAPMFSNADGNLGDPYGPGVHRRYAGRDTHGQGGLVPQGISAELVAEQWGLTRADLDTLALRSHQRAAAARDGGRFDDEIAPLPGRRRDTDTDETVETDDVVRYDEGIRETSLDKLAALKRVFLPDGLVTAGNSSQISDGAAAVLVMSEDMAAGLGLQPKARIVDFALAGSDPVVMLTAPIPATKKVLHRSGLEIGDIDLFEVNEAFAPVVLAWQREMGVNADRVNVNGGAIALGHPLGASGTRLMTTLVAEMNRTGARYGLQTMCEGGGMANAIIVERVT